MAELGATYIDDDSTTEAGADVETTLGAAVDENTVSEAGGSVNVCRMAHASGVSPCTV